MSAKILPQQVDVFKLIKDIPVIEIARRYLPGELRRQGSRWVTRCPFHEDHSPSLVIFQNGWRCFGCGEHGDGVDLVARLYGLHPLDAARMIARDFGISLPSDSFGKRAQARQAAARRELEARFHDREREVFRFLASIYRSLSYTLAEIRDAESLDRLGDLYHVQAILEHVLDVLRTGTARDRAAILRDERLQRVVSTL